MRIPWGHRMKATVLILGMVVILCAASSEAAPITFAFEGTVTSVGALDPANPFPTEPTFGTPFSGSYTFDSTAADGAPGDPTTGSYASAGGPYGISIALGGLTLSYGGVAIGVTDGYSSYGPGDQYLVGFSGGPTLLSLRFTDFSEAMFSNDALPLSPIAIAGLFTELNFSDIVDGNQVDLQGTLTSLTCSAGCPAVPEPSIIPLLGAGIGALGGVRYLRRRA